MSSNYERVSTNDFDDIDMEAMNDPPVKNRRSSNYSHSRSSFFSWNRMFLAGIIFSAIVLYILITYGGSKPVNNPPIKEDAACSSSYSPDSVIAALDKAAATIPTEESNRDRLFMYQHLTQLGPRQSCPADHYAGDSLCIGYCSNIAATMKALSPLRFSLSSPANKKINSDNTNHVCHFIPPNPSILFPLLREGVCQPDESTLPDKCAHWSVWNKNEITPSDKPPCWSSLSDGFGDRLRSAMLLNGKVKVDVYHMNDNTTPGQRSITQEKIEELSKDVRRIVKMMETNNNNWQPITKEQGGDYGPYPDTFLLPALKRYQYAFKGLRVAVFGTETPWVEAALIELGAEVVVTVEYTPIITHHPKHRSMLPTQVAKQVSDGTFVHFEAAASFSSLEHDGLGRYGDPINPFGDLQTMVKTSCLLAPGAFFFWAVPVTSDDYLLFNLHRVYGKYRLPLALRNWHIVDVIGATEAQYQRWVNGTAPKGPWNYHTQFIFVLQNRIGCTDAQLKQPDQ